MGVTVPIARDDASEVVAAPCIELSVVAESCKWFPALAKFLSPKKPAPTVHFLTGEPERTCYEWVRGKFDPPSRVLLRLLHTDQGWRVLEFIMRGCKQPWWIETVRARRCAAAYEQERDQFSLDL